MKTQDVRQNPKIKQVGEYYGMITLGLFVFQTNLLLFLFMFKKSIWIMHLIAFLLITFFALLFKDFTNEKQKKLGFKLFKISILIFSLACIDHVIVTGLAKVQDPGLYNKMSGLIYIFDFAILISSIAFYKNPNVVMGFEGLYEESVLNKILGDLNEEIKEGDAVIGIDVNTKKPVRLPLKDRFLHMLILGPTGSGKTSQSIIPMINRDMQWKEAGIIVLEPKGDLAEKIYAMARSYDRDVMYFNPVLPDCPYFNPLFGDESDVVENMATTFKMFSVGSSQFFLDQNDQLVRKSLKVLKRVKGDDATLIDMSNLLNGFKEGQEILNKFSRLGGDTNFVAENLEIYQWFKNDYYSALGGGKGGTKTYEHCSAVRTQVAKLISNKYLRKVLNPPAGKNDIDFDKALSEGKVITMATAQGTLRDLGRFLGYFLILQLQSSVFRRPGNEDTRRPCFLYIDEFQVYSNPGFADMLTQGRSYRVASHLATQNRALIGMGSGKDGKDFIELVSTNARNVIIYPGGNATDAEYYSKEFGEAMEMTIHRGESRQKFNPLYGFGMKAPTESLSYQEELKSRFTATDIRFREFGEVTYCIIKNNSIQIPGVSKIEYIPKELNEKLNKMVDEYTEEQIAKSDGKLRQELEINKSEEDFVSIPISENEGDFTIPDPMSEIDEYSMENQKKSPNTKKASIFEEYEDFIENEDTGAKTKNGPVLNKDDYRVIGHDLNIGEEEDDLI